MATSGKAYGFRSRVHPLPMLEGLAPLVSGGIILSEWSGLDWIAYCYDMQPAWNVSGLNRLFPGAPGQDSTE